MNAALGTAGVALGLAAAVVGAVTAEVDGPVLRLAATGPGAVVLALS